MKYKKYVYEDTTGSGEDAMLILPIWADPPVFLETKIKGQSSIEWEIVDEEGLDTADPNQEL